MYYVIKRQHNVPLSSFFCFKIEKYIASKDHDSIIVEFMKGDKKIRKWIKKEDIILITKDETFFIKIKKHFMQLESLQKELVDHAQEELDKSIEEFSESMNLEINEFNKLKHKEDIPCELKKML